MKKISLTFIAFIFVSNAWGGLFGASNYDECMLEKMKGQANSMRSSAENACEIAFPTEKLLDTNIFSAFAGSSTSADISYEYKKITNELIDFNVRNNSNYKITKINVITKSSCDKNPSVLDDVEIIAPLFTPTYTAKVRDTRKVKCIDVQFFGKRVK